MARVADGAKWMIREGLRRAGLTVQRRSPATVPDLQIQTLLRHHEVDLVIDVGANAGQYALALRHAGYRGRILSFEPLRSAWDVCAARASRDALWDMAPRTALGASSGVVDIHIAGNSASSSILPMKDAHRQAAPESAYVGREPVDLRRLDDVGRDAIERATSPFLKIDTQGYEQAVLEGASGVIERLIGIQLEISLTPLYEGSPTLLQLLEMMQQRGFTPQALLPTFTDTQTGRMLQVDGLFFREPVSAAVPHSSDDRA
jgi:FkbM family methyltransferase